jgi:hypothetical protein
LKDHFGCCPIVAQLRAEDEARELAAKLKVEAEERQKAQDRDALKNWFARVNPPNNDIVSLNVRGKFIQTTYSTLTKYPHSKLGSLFSDRSLLNLQPVC